MNKTIVTENEMTKNDELLQRQLNEVRLHYRRLLLERGRELGEAKAALGIILRELLAARENSGTLRDALPGDFSEPGALAKAIRTLCDIATSKTELQKENAQLRYDIGCMRAEIEELGSELDALRAFLNRQESEKPPF